MGFFDPIAKFLNRIKVGNDFINILNYAITPIILLIFILLSHIHQWCIRPVECWVPNTFTKAMEDYTERYCWVQNTYFLPLHDYIPQNDAERENRQISYYGWITTYLFLHAAFSFLPCTVWNGCFPNTKASKSDQYTKQKSPSLLGRLKGFPNVIIKIVCLIVAVMQMSLITSFLGYSDTYWAFAHLRDLKQNREWTQSVVLPRVTLCDFEVKVLGNVHRHTVQCVMSMSQWYENIYLCIWLWFFCLAVITALNIFYWIALSILIIVCPAPRKGLPYPSLPTTVE